MLFFAFLQAVRFASDFDNSAMIQDSRSNGDILSAPTDEAVREAEDCLLGVETNITNWQHRQNQNNKFSTMAQREGVTEALKAVNQMEWVGRMNSIRNRAEEMVLHKLIYAL